ncbi:MFS transporter [Kaustia mangrovi]|uniref:MFS transporter n=1 Tax=Kaustia mangrovi TaxID=2593653 RepID=A0A7S8C7Q0_9HYPH|nr:MFS transporter [Kaustia mangrovi]QPC44912.1 MFS transporter [Kaustia mangrovi]
MSHTAANPHHFVDDGLARRNAVLLAAGQALYSSSTVILITSAGLVGQILADDKGLATLPVSTFVIGTALTTVPASLFMRRVGRRPGFIVGALLGLVSALLAIYAVMAGDFWLFSLATACNGVYQAFAQYYRFAAADTASEAFKAKAISWVLIGGIVSAILGPLIVMGTKDAFPPFLFVGSYAASGVLAIVAMSVLAFVKIPHRRPEPGGDGGRALSVLLRQPRLVVAVICGMMSYGMMNLVMTATPLAMVGCGHTVNDAAWVIQWHVLAMYVPSFFTGQLINRFGVEKIVATGMVFLAGAGFAALAGIGFGNFAVALVFLGVGWNFGFVGATTMVTDCYKPAEKNRVQAVNDFAIFATVAVASLSSGKLLDAIGWDAVNLALFPMIALVLAMLLWSGRGRIGRSAV